MGPGHLPLKLMPLPPRPQRLGDVLTWCGRLWEWARALKPLGGPGIIVRASPSGHIISVASGLRRKTPPPFCPRRVRKGADATYEVTIHPGYLVDIVTMGSTSSTPPDGRQFFDPKVTVGETQVSIFSRPRPVLQMEVGQTAVLEYRTDKFGNVKTDVPVAIKVMPDADAKTEHYQPKDGDGEGGADGLYRVRLFTLETRDGVVEARVYQQSDVEHYHDLWTGKNIGSGVGVYKGRNAELDSFEFHKILAKYGLVASKEGDDIRLNFLPENKGDGRPVWIEPTDGNGDPLGPEDFPSGPAGFRTIMEESGNLIKVECEAPNPGDPLPNEIKVKSAGADVAEGSVEKFSIQVIKGVISSFTKESVTGWWGTVAISFDHAQGGVGEISLDFEAGRLMSVHAAGSFAFSAGAGTEGDLGTVSLAIEDTDTV